MKRTLAILLAVLLIGLSTASLAAETISIAATSVPHGEVLEFIKPMMAEKGYNLDIRIFQDYVQPNMVVASGEMDANYFQHSAFLFDFNAKNNAKLELAIPVHFEPMGVFKGKTQSLDELPDGAVIGVPNDPSNEARALNLLASLGLIELREGAGVEATKLDIVKNEKNLEIAEVEAASLPRMLPDFDLAVINGNYALEAGLSVLTDTVGAETSDAEVYASSVNYLVVGEGKSDEPFVDALREVLNDEATLQFLVERYAGSVIPALDAEIPTAPAN